MGNVSVLGNKRMKKIPFVCFLFFVVFVSHSFAADNNANLARGNLTISNKTGEGPGIVFTPSPNTLISCSTSATAYTIVAASNRTSTDNGIEYCLISSNNNIYQKTQAKNSIVTQAGTSPGSKPGEDKDWTNR